MFKACKGFISLYKAYKGLSRLHKPYKAFIIVYLFNSINQDSTKNQFYIQQSNFDQLNINEFTKKLKEYHKDSFSKKKASEGLLKILKKII